MKGGSCRVVKFVHKLHDPMNTTVILNLNVSLYPPKKDACLPFMNLRPDDYCRVLLVSLVLDMVDKKIQAQSTLNQSPRTLSQL